VNNSAQRPRVAFQGERGAFSEAAAIALLGTEIELVPRATFAALFSSVAEGLADYALAPVENSLIGNIEPVVSLLGASALISSGQIVIQIEQQLIGCPGAVIEEIETVESHPAALAQCQRFFGEHPLIERVEADDTAASVARIVSSGDRTRAAIASRRAAEIYGGCIIKENLEDDPENYTRFILLTATDKELKS
jgi:prephenate dehydratase